MELNRERADTDTLEVHSTGAARLSAETRDNLDEKMKTNNINDISSSASCVNTDDNLFICVVCDANFSCKDNLKRHMHEHTEGKTFFCTVCGCKCAHAGHLNDHMRIHTGEKPFICTVCEAKFTQAGNLKTHMRFHTGDKEFMCTVCGAKFTRAGDLKRHISSIVGGLY